jgi:LacI family transcriptional regulator
MKDIARDLGVSVMTVSKVIRNVPDISEETRRRVLKRIKELNYTPNAAAQALVTGRSKVIALVVPDLVHPFFAEVAKGLSAVLRSRGYSLVISSSEEDPALEQNEIEHLLARGVDALIIASVQTAPESFGRIEERRTPYVLIDRKFERLSANFIGVDDVHVGRLATQHLLDVGCRRIAHIAGGDVSTASGRLDGYLQTLRRRGISVQDDLIVSRRAHADDLGDVTGYEAMEHLLGVRPRPDGVFCFNDPTAVGATLAILDHGLKIPDDVAVVGCGNVHYSKFLRVPLTSISQQTETMGRKAGQLALALVNAKGAAPARIILLEPRLEVRQSTSRLVIRGAQPAARRTTGRRTPAKRQRR